LTLLEVDPNVRATVPKHRRRGKGCSAYAPAFDPDREQAPSPITLAKIDPARHADAFRRAMDLAERVEQFGEWR
jgi:hypothetical protein